MHPPVREPWSRQRNRAIALGNRGAAYKLMGRYDEAIADFTRAIELDPDNPQYYCQRGDVRLRTNGDNEAIDDYTIAIRQSSRLSLGLSWPRAGLPRLGRRRRRRSPTSTKQCV